MWTVQAAKAQLSEVLKRAKSGEPQFIGLQDPCVVISSRQFEIWNRTGKPDFGQFLIDNMPAGIDLELPSREDRRGDPFQHPGEP